MYSSQLDFKLFLLSMEDKDFHVCRSCLHMINCWIGILYGRIDDSEADVVYSGVYAGARLRKYKSSTV